MMNEKTISSEAFIAIVAVAFVLMPLIAFSLFSFYTVSQSLTDIIKNELEAKSILVTHDVNSFIGERIIDARIISQADVLESQNLTAKIQYLTEIITEDKWISDIDIIDKTGTIIASSGIQNEKGKLFWELYPIEQSLFLSASKAQQGQVYVSEALSLDTGPGVLFITPITNDKNTTSIGLLAIEVNLKHIANIVSLVNQGIIGEKYVYIVDNDGRVIISDDPTVKFLDRFPDLQTKPELMDAFSRQGKIGNIIYTDHTGDQVMAGYADMAEFGENEALDWSLIAIAPMNEITAPVTHLEQLLFIIGSIIALLSGFLAYRTVTFINKKLANLATQADAISQGNFATQKLTESNRKGAFNTLVIAINRMQVNIHQLIGEIKDREQRLNITLNSIGDAVIATDEKGNVTSMNPIAENLTGWSFQEAQGHPLKIIFPIIDASTREPLENPVDKVIITGETIYLSNHTTLISKNGTEYQIADSAAPIQDNGHILGMVLVFNDVTERYQLREAAAKSKRDLEAILDHSPSLIYVKGLSGRYIFINRHYENLFHVKRKEFIGHTDHDIFPKEFSDEFRSNDEKVIASGYPIESEEVVPQGDEVHTYHAIKFPLYDDAGNIYATCGMASDITERKLKDEQLRRSQKMDALGKMTGGIAHDYNNMLGIILGYSDLIEEMVREQPKLTEYISRIRHAGERGAKLTKKLLTFSRHQPSENKIVNLNSFLEGSQLMLEKTLTVRIQLVYELEKLIWSINLDEGDLEDAILNMSINAMHAIEGAGQITFETRNEVIEEIDAQHLEITAGDYVLLSITDTGCGMDNKTKEKIFDPFFSTKGEVGTGLGLSQVYGFAKKSKGNVKIYSELGHGSRFTLYFPRYNGSDIEEKQFEEREETNLSGNQIILVVDDEPALAELTSHILTKQGYQVFIANSGKEALLILEKEPVNVLFSDVIMAEMDGYQLAAIVQEEYPSIKIQLASGFDDDRHISNINASLRENLLHKPYHSKRLLLRIRELLNGS